MTVADSAQTAGSVANRPVDYTLDAPRRRFHGQHRPDIDGLRAIAILSVLGFHAFGLPGGFVGVDIFFVISGYLISGILLRGLKNGEFSFTGFYVRRVKRIFPALLLVLLVTAIAGWYALLPDEYQRLGKHILSGAGFMSNFTLWKEAGYFDQRSALKPLLHLWSLGVEEQFYLIWPLVLFIAWRRRINLLPVIVAIMAVSFVWDIARVQAHEAATFYLPASRFWELLLGAVLAHREVFRREAARDLATGRVHHLAAWLGVCLILGSVIFLDSHVMFPGWWALPPTLGGLLLIYAGPEAWINRRVLASRPMVFIGLISYPLYLWHWPLISFAAIVAPQDTSAPFKATLMIVAIVLAWFTYRLVERPVRSSPALIRVAWPLALLMAVLGVFGLASFRGGIEPRSARYGLGQIIEASNAMAFPGPGLKDLDAAPTPLKRQTAGDKTVLFIGDSFIEQYYPRIDWLLRHNPERAASVVYASSGGCAPIPGVKEQHHAYCLGLVDRAMSYAADHPEVSSVVIGANWVGYFVEMDARYAYYFDDAGRPEPLAPGSRGSELAMSALKAMIARLVQEGKNVYLILQSPHDDALDPRTMIDGRWGAQSFRIKVPVISRDRVTRSVRPIAARLRAIAEATGAQVIDPIEYLCGANCPVMTRDGLPIYRDEGHLNPGYVRANVRYLDRILLPHSG